MHALKVAKQGNSLGVTLNKEGPCACTRTLAIPSI